MLDIPSPLSGFGSPFRRRRSFSPAVLFANGEAGVWLDPSDLGTMFTDTAGTTPAAVGDPVARIDDKSGNGHHATQAVLASRPILRQSGGLHYLEFDGVDDALVTPTITPGTDKAQVFAGVRKLSDAAVIVAETSVDVRTNAGSFHFVAGENLTSQYSSNAVGSATASGFTIARILTGFAPDTAVLAATHDIAGDLSTMRRNGVAGTDGTADKGTGDFLAYPLYIGARAGTSLFFDGHIYSLVTRFGDNLDAATIGKAERYVAQKTGVVIA